MKAYKLVFSIIAVLSLAFLAAGCSSAASSGKGSKTASLQYLGHSAFVVTDTEGSALGIDLYAKGAFKYSEDLPVDMGFSEDNKLENVIRTHGHVDHSRVPKGAKEIRDISGEKPYSLGKMLISGFETEHFPPNTVYGKKYNYCILIETNGVRILHMGDAFGTMSDTKKLEELKKQVGNVDILMLPIGDYELKPTDFESLKNTLAVMAPRITIPVHYWSVADKEAFLNRIKESGYTVENIDNNLKTLSKKGIAETVGKTVWSIKPGVYAKQ